MVFPLAFFGNALASEELICRSDLPTISIIAGDPSMARMACDAVAASIIVLEECNLTQKAAIRITVDNKPISDDPRCFGQFHCNRDDIDLVSPERLSEALPPDHPLTAIPPERLFASIVTHEMAHAFLYQMRGGPGDTIAEDEYVAYAMQYLSLTEDDRAALLEAMPGQGTRVTRDMLNDTFLALSPMIFGSWAWRHFQRQEDGCGFIRGIIAQEVDFSLDEPYRCNDPPECTR